MSGVPYAFLDEDFEYCLQVVLHLRLGILYPVGLLQYFSKIPLPFHNISGCQMLTMHIGCFVESNSQPFSVGSWNAALPALVPEPLF